MSSRPHEEQLSLGNVNMCAHSIAYIYTSSCDIVLIAECLSTRHIIVTLFSLSVYIYVRHA